AVGGHATIDGRPVTVCGDDDTVRRGTSGPRGSLKATRLREMAVLRGNPFVLFGQAAGAPLPENLLSHSFATNGRVGNFDWLLGRGRSVPVVSLIVGDSFGQSSFYSAPSDFVVQAVGTCLALTSPPSSAGRALPATEVAESGDDDQLAGLVPLRRTRAYDVRRVIARLVD